ncbi:Uma2 family endonuclease [Leptolyngbya sp. AN03gr2]|uniref:Uma2 family endonuclease n=1 Tax=unclassified Leptolyngbya TaxID=2650499 RepID=UPI003D313491
MNLPETKPASEFIDGQIIQKPMPTGRRSTIQGELSAAISSEFRNNKIARAFLELCCVFDDQVIVPDIAVFAWDRIPRDSDGRVANEFCLAPDWTIEIQTPTTKLIKKTLHGLEHGTQMTWIIDLEERAILVYCLHRFVKLYDLDTPEVQIAVPEFAKNFELTVGQVFQWLED